MSDHTTIPEKCCSRCKTYFPATTEYFYRESRRNDGLRSECKSCDRAYRQRNREQRSAYVREYRAANRDYLNEKDRTYRSQNKDRQRLYREANKERRQEQNREWRMANRDYVKNKRHERYIANREESIEYSRQYRIEHPERLAEYKRRNRERYTVHYRNYRARKRNLVNDFTVNQQRFALEFFHNSCAYCGRQLFDLFHEHYLAFDHFIPLTADGCPGTTATNMLPSCHGIDGCNSRKQNKEPREWLILRFGKHRARKLSIRIEEYFEIVRLRSIEETE